MGRGKQFIESTVVFEPVVGKDYASNGRKFLGRKVMVVGASHYCDAHFKASTGCCEKCKGFGKFEIREDEKVWYFGARCEKFSQIVYGRYRAQVRSMKERYWFCTLSRFYNSFFCGGNPSHADRVRLLDHIVCTEYMQGVEGDGPESRNDWAMAADRNFDEFMKAVAEYKPEVLIFWGPRAWKEVCRRCGIDDLSSTIQNAKIGGRRVSLIRTPHPSASRKGGFNRANFQAQLKEVGVNVFECRLDLRDRAINRRA